VLNAYMTDTVVLIRKNGTASWGEKSFTETPARARVEYTSRLIRNTAGEVVTLQAIVYLNDTELSVGDKIRFDDVEHPVITFKKLRHFRRFHIWRLALAKTFTLKVDAFIENLGKINARIEQGFETGIGRALLQIKTDTVMQRPTAPIREGFLRGSASIHVQERELPVPLGPGERSDKKAMGYKIPLQHGKIIGLIGFNVPYASRTHEVPMHFRDREAGNKYLESKMSGNRMIYKKIITNAVNAMQ
jgi:hypothetical protein